MNGRDDARVGGRELALGGLGCRKVQRLVLRTWARSGAPTAVAPASAGPSPAVPTAPPA